MMSGDDFGRAIYLGLLILFVGSALFIGGRSGIGTKLRHMLTWVGIFLMLILAYGQRDAILSQLVEQEAESIGAGEIAVPRSPSGSFQATLNVNGVPIRFLIDTGASDVVLSRADARRAGIEPGKLDFRGRAVTANGTVRIAGVTLERVEFAGLVDNNVRASVNEGDLDMSLLGMSYLDRFERIEITADRMVLSR